MNVKKLFLIDDETLSSIQKIYSKGDNSKQIDACIID